MILLPPCGTAIFVRVAGDESKERRIRILAVENLCQWNRLPFVSRSFRPFWKNTVRRMRKSQLTLRNPFCLSVASLTDFSKLTFSQVFWKICPRLFGYFWGDAKSNNRDSPLLILPINSYNYSLFLLLAPRPIHNNQDSY